MKKIFISLLIIITTLGYSQKTVKKSQITIIPSISNLKLGINEDEIIKKYGLAKIDTTTNSSRFIMYDRIKLDNNFELESISFRFFKKKLFMIIFNSNTDIHNGLTSKYGYREFDDESGIYGNFKNNIRFGLGNIDGIKYEFLIDDNLRKLSESEGF